MLKGEMDVKVVLDSEKESRAIYEALKPELSSSPSDRTRVNADCRGKRITLVFRGYDTASLRSSINSYLRWMMTGSSILALERSD
jgi:KEOPS complex subunit Pcc1